MSLLEKYWVPYLLIFLLALAQYANTRNHGFAWDDVIIMTENSRVQQGLSDIPSFFENIKTTKTENRYGYRPIALLSFATDVEFFGVNSHASHRISILLYGVLCALVFFFLQTIFPDRKWFNFLVAVLFAVHPLHTEVVANIKSRDEVLAMLFGISSLCFFWYGLERKQLFHHALFALLLLLAFLSKENAVVFCGVAVLMVWYRFPERTWNERLRSALAVAFVLALLVATRVYVYSDLFFQNEDYELYTKGIFLQDGFVGNPLFGLDSDVLLLCWNVIYLNGLYLLKFLVPYPLVHDYGYDYLKLVGFGSPEAWLAFVVFIGMLVFLYKGLRKRTVYGFGLAFYFITASIYLHVAGLAPDIFAERFMFIPLLGLALVLVDVLHTVSDRSKNARMMAVMLLAVVSIAFFVLSAHRNKAWKDNKTLFETDLARLHQGARANYNYALLLHGIYYEGAEARQRTLPDSILHHYERALQITDRLYPAYLDLGGAYMEFGKPDEAKEVFQMAMERYPQIAASYVQMGKYHMTFKQFDQAVPYFEKAIEIGAQGTDYYYYLAICEFNSGNHAKAIEVLRAGEATGDVSAAYFGLMANLHLRLGELDSAQQVLQRGLAAYPNNNELLQLRNVAGSE